MRLTPVTLVVTFVLGLLAGPLPTEAQQAGKVYRIGYLSTRSLRQISSSASALRQGLRDLGYVEGQNIVIEWRFSKGKHERLPDLAADLVRLKVDVIVTGTGTPAIRAAKRATRTIPIVMVGVNVDPVEAGYVMSLARPGGNITGLTNLDSKLHGKRLELLKEVFPRISSVAILWPPGQQKHGMKEVKAGGQALGIQIQSVVYSRRLGVSIESALSAISRARPDGLLVVSAGSTNRSAAGIIEFVAHTSRARRAGRGLPTIYAGSRFVDAGGLMSYGTNRPDLFRRAATFVDKILKGAKPADLPVEQPTKFDLVINLKTAKQLGTTIPPTLLLQATKVIK